MGGEGRDPRTAGQGRSPEASAVVPFVHEERFERHIIRVTGVPWIRTTIKVGTGTLKEVTVLTEEVYNRCRELVAYVLLYGKHITLTGYAYTFIREVLEVELSYLATRLEVKLPEIEQIESDAVHMTSVQRDQFLLVMRWFAAQDIGGDELPNIRHEERGSYTVWTISYIPFPTS